MELKVLKVDEDMVARMTPEQLAAYYDNETAYSVVPFKPKKDPNNAWAVPFVTNHKYKLHWRYGLDFTQMQFDLSTRWNDQDKGIHFVHNFTDVREAIDVVAGDEVIPNNTLPGKAKANRRAGDNVVYNKTEERRIEFWVDGKNKSKSSIKLIGWRCKNYCPKGVEEKPIEDAVRRWSDKESWPLGILPQEGETVVIEPGWNMLYDLEESPIFNMVEINGRLTFEDADKDLHLRAKYVYVRAGELIIGTQEQPFNRTAKITLYGEKENQHILWDNAIEAGNKILANTNKISMYGKSRHSHSRLTKSA
jgi:hypothetical protein